MAEIEKSTNFSVAGEQTIERTAPVIALVPFNRATQQLREFFEAGREKVENEVEQATEPLAKEEFVLNEPEDDEVPCLDDVEPKDIEWLIEGLFPLRGLSVLAGPGGSGKGITIAQVIAYLTTGKPSEFFPSPAPITGTVLIISAEDDPASVLGPRVRAAGADMKRVRYMTPEKYAENNNESLQLGTAMDRLINRSHPVAVVLDPYQHFLPKGTSVNCGNQLREALKGLEEKSEKEGIGMILVAHTNKKEGTDARRLLAGAGELWNFARSVVMVGVVKGSSKTYLTQVKTNGGKMSRTILFHKEDALVHTRFGRSVKTVKAVFDAFTEKRFEDFAGEKVARATDNLKEEAKVAILEILKACPEGRMGGTELKAEVREETGCRNHTCERAHSELTNESKIRSERVCQSDGKYKWMTVLCSVATADGEVA